MKIDHALDDASGQYVITGAPDEYDAHSFPDALRLDRAPEAIAADRVAIAAALLFGDRLSEKLELPAAVSPLVADQIERYFADQRVRVSPVDLKPVKLPIGFDRAVILGPTENSTVTHVPVTQYRTTTLRFNRNDRHIGAAYSVDELSLPSNAWLFESQRTPRPVVLAALATLYAEDVEVYRLEIPSIGALSDEHQARLIALLAATGLTVRRP